MKNTADALPPLFLQRLQKILSVENYQRYLFSLEKKPVTCFRVNTLKIAVSDLIQRLETQDFNLTPISWCHEAWCVPYDERRRLTETTEFKEGLFYIQNPSSL